MTQQPVTEQAAQTKAERSGWIVVATAWTLVGVPLAWGIYKTLEKALVLFR